MLAAVAPPSQSVQRFVEQASRMAHHEAPPFSAQERFQRLLSQGLVALRGGSYGIAACFVIRGHGHELELFGHNTLLNDDPQGHAEMNAVRRATRLLRLPEHRRSESLRALVDKGQAAVRRTTDDAPFATELFSTLEPCPMCTVCALNAGIGTITYAHDDELAGALAAERRRQLAPLWGHTAREQGLEVLKCQSEDERDPRTYVPPELLDVLIDLFEVSRPHLDSRLSEQGFFHPYRLLESAKQLSS
jgi:tRNA(Arg) A34 adenosine deaminase TadA